MSARAGKNKFNRVLLKLSGEVLQNKQSGQSVDFEAASKVAGQVKAATDMGIQVAIVIGGGNIVRGAAAGESGLGRVMSDYMGMMATVINSLALKIALEKAGIQALVQSAIQVGHLAEPVVAETAVRNLEKGRVVVFAGGTGNPFFSTDTTAALRASEIGADVVLKATKVDGIYTADPKKDPKASRITSISYSEVLKRELKIMDASAFAICMENRIPIIVFDFFSEGSIIKVLEGKPVGTVVS